MRSEVFSCRGRQKAERFFYQMQAGENPVNNDHYLTMQIFMEQL